MQNQAIETRPVDRAGCINGARPAIRCPSCGHVVFDGLVIKSRIIRVLPNGAEAKCQCKAWVLIPIAYKSF